MKRILSLAVCIFSFTSVCFAQHNETMSINAYYPSPSGVYQSVQFFPNNVAVSGNACAQEGDTSYSANELYICKGSSPTWQAVGSTGTGIRAESGHNISPSTCGGTVSPAGVCNDEWFQYITFDEPFAVPPNVIVAPEVISDPALTPCAGGRTDMVFVYPRSITANGFFIHGSGSPYSLDSSCPEEGHRTRTRVGWIAIGN